MKLVILGANGRTGRHVLKVALRQDMIVTAVVRNADKAPILRHDRLKVVVGDPCDAAFLKTVFSTQDAVISVLGGRRPTRAATSVYYRSAEAIVESATESGLRRVLVTSTALLFRRQSLMGGLLRLLVPHVVHSAARMEDALHHSRLDWTIARPGFLTYAETVAFRTARNALPKGGASVSRLALAEFLVEAIQNPDSFGATFGVSDLLAQRRESIADRHAGLRAS